MLKAYKTVLVPAYLGKCLVSPKFPLNSSFDFLFHYPSIIPIWAILLPTFGAQVKPKQFHKSKRHAHNWALEAPVAFKPMQRFKA